MKKIVKWILPLVLVIALVASAVWYMFVYDRDTVQDFLVAMARNCAEDGNFEGATWFYDLSYQLSEEDQNVAEVFLNRLEPGSPFPRLESNASSYVQNPDDNNYLYNWVAPYYGGWENIPQELYDAYDTYKKAGLPAGPISNPGIEAIKAVVNPNTELVSENGHSPCYFFVTDLTGRYYYAATASEHQANVNTAWAVNDAL